MHEADYFDCQELEDKMSDFGTVDTPLLDNAPFTPVESGIEEVSGIRVRKKYVNKYFVFVALLVTVCIFLSIALVAVSLLWTTSSQSTAKSKRDVKSLSHFFHVSDTHLDIYYDSNVTTKNYQMCRNRKIKQRPNGTIGRSDTVALFGRNRCDSPALLMESLKSYLIKLKAGLENDLEFVLVTGDQAAHDYDYFDVNLMESVIGSIANSSKYLSDAFPTTPLFFAVGNNDLHYDYDPPVCNHSEFYQALRGIWEPLIFPVGSRIAALNSIEDFRSSFEFGGYYKVIFNAGKMVLVVLNTNYWSGKAYKRDPNVTATGDIQLKWLDEQLNATKSNGQHAIIAGHIPPGFSAHDQKPLWLLNYTNVYSMLVTMKYPDIVKGQLYGHIHHDRIKMQYLDDVHASDKDTGKAFVLTCPSITPIYGINPAFRIFDYNTDTRQLLDYTQYYLDLAASNVNKESIWQKDYSFVDTYNVPLSVAGIEKIIRDILNPFSSTWFHYFVHLNARFGGKFYSRRYIEYCTARHVSEHAYRTCIEEYKNTGS